MSQVKIKSENIDFVSTASLKRHPKNMHEHSEDQLKRLAKLIEYQGWRVPLIVQKGTDYIVAGNGRHMVAEREGIEKVPVIYQEFESEAQLYAFIVSDNAIGKDTWATLDLSKINDEALKLEELDIDMLGIKDFQVTVPETLQPGCDEDEAPEPPEEPVTKRGDVWLLGDHRLMCGDSTMIDDVEKLMNGLKADLTFTSPPYNANAKTGDGDIFNKKKSREMYQGKYKDNFSSEDYLNFVKQVLENCFLQTDGFIFWNVSYNSKSKFEYIAQIQDRISYLIEQICWKKSSTIPFKGMLMRDWEPIYVFSTNRQNLNLKEVTSNHWQVGNTSSQQENHKACFPVALPEKAIGLVNVSHGVVLDPFLGSGTSLIAAEKKGRKCFGLELDESYCDVIINRWQKYTSKEAKLESTGETYNQLKESRNGKK